MESSGTGGGGFTDTGGAFSLIKVHFSMFATKKCSAVVRLLKDFVDCAHQKTTNQSINQSRAIDQEQSIKMKMKPKERMCQHSVSITTQVPRPVIAPDHSQDLSGKNERKN